LLQRLEQMRDGQAVLLAAPGAARIVVLLASREAPIAYEQARPVIEQALRAERQREAVRAGLESARRASQIRYVGSFAGAASAVPAAAQAAASAAEFESTRKGLAGLR
jgi:Lon protease-like protein